ncbi:hypothetical protein V1264_005119 [Littorina saxatilis]|uniref:Integrase catalytic domain-containing protein n=1 Tax=Littorina saxatilis TaxID=31220 RepID=A0AAN9AYK6_9CAEN
MRGMSEKEKETHDKRCSCASNHQQEFASRGQVDLVDMQSMPSNGYKWIMVYQDHLTKFCVLRPIRSKRAVEVAAQLLDIFLVIGAPAILQSDNGTELTANIISELKDVWPTLVLVHGKPRHPQSQGSVERANGDIKDMLVAWLADNHTQDWATGIKFVQFYKNSSHHSGIKRSPYSALFGSEASVGLTTSSLPFEVLKNLETEEDLLALVLHQPSSESSDPSPTESNPQTPSESNPPAPSESNPQAHSESNPPAPSESNSQAPSESNPPAPSESNSQAPSEILHRDVETDIYTIAVKADILHGGYSRNQFDLCPQRLLTEEDVSLDKAVSLRSAVIEQSASGGQGLVKCSCAGSTKCKTNRCKCYKAKVLCNSRCHSSQSCTNK